MLPLCNVAIPSFWGLFSYLMSGWYYHRLMSQSLLFEVFFPITDLPDERTRRVFVAIPSFWGLFSYNSNLYYIGLLFPGVAIPSFWGLFSYTDDNDIVINITLSQSLLFEVFFPITGNIVAEICVVVAIPSFWGLFSYLIGGKNEIESCRNPFFLRSFFLWLMADKIIRDYICRNPFFLRSFFLLCSRRRIILPQGRNPFFLRSFFLSPPRRPWSGLSRNPFFLRSFFL